MAALSTPARQVRDVLAAGGKLQAGMEGNVLAHRLIRTDGASRIVGHATFNELDNAGMLDARKGRYVTLYTLRAA